MHEAHMTKSHYEINSKDQGSLVFVEKERKPRGNVQSPKKVMIKITLCLHLGVILLIKEKNITVTIMHLYQ